jgi:acetoacetate decarboxylase
MPVTAPAVQSPPFYYRNMEMIIVEYRTAEEEALELLPDGLELLEPATASLVIAKYHFSTFGPYNEAILCLGCKWQGEPMSFLPNLFVTQEAPLIAGREIWGYAKKLAHVDVLKEHEEYMGIIERPRGNRLATAVMRTVRNVPADQFKFPKILSLKVIPNAEESESPAIAQLVSCDFRVTPVVATDGRQRSGAPRLARHNSPTEVDPWHLLSVKEIVSCRYGWFNAYPPYGKIHQPVLGRPAPIRIDDDRAHLDARGAAHRAERPANPVCAVWRARPSCAEAQHLNAGSPRRAVRRRTSVPG